MGARGQGVQHRRVRLDRRAAVAARHREMRHRVYEPDPVFIGRNISLKHNVSRERIQQIEVRAFEKLQKNIKRAPAKEGLLPLA